MDVLLYFAIPVWCILSLAATAVFLLVWLIKWIAKKEISKPRRRFLVSAGCVVISFAIIMSYPREDTPEKVEAKPTPTVAVEAEPKETENTEPEVPDDTVSWKDEISDDLAQEIEVAFAEIGENPENIVNIEYVDTHTSGYIFEQKCYRVEFSYSFMNPGWEHAREYRIMTQNYFDGEPEKVEYPDEFLITIKYWVGDDGHGTNINQWSWTGNGKMQ